MPYRSLLLETDLLYVFWRPGSNSLSGVIGGEKVNCGLEIVPYWQSQNPSMAATLPVEKHTCLTSPILTEPILPRLAVPEKRDIV